MTGLSNLGIILTSIFTLLFLALIAELIYLYIIRQRRHRRLTATTTTTTSSNPLPPTCGNLKSVILNILSWKTQSRIEPSTAGINQSSTTEPEMSAEDIEIAELLKLQNSRLLFTIREEEREGIDSSATERSSSVGERRNRRNNVSERRSKSTSLDFAVGGGGGSATSFSASVESPEVCLVVVVEGNESGSDEGHMTTTSYLSLENSSSCSSNSSSCSAITTPYSTPCQSPVAYFTPPGSPSRVVRDANGGTSSDGGGWWSA